MMYLIASMVPRGDLNLTALWPADFKSYFANFAGSCGMSHVVA